MSSDQVTFDPRIKAIVCSSGFDSFADYFGGFKSTLGEDISDLPAVGICPEYMCEKAIAIGTYCVASGIYTLFGVGSPVEASEEVTRTQTLCPSWWR